MESVQYRLLHGFDGLLQRLLHSVTLVLHTTPPVNPCPPTLPETRIESGQAVAHLLRLPCTRPGAPESWHTQLLSSQFRYQEILFPPRQQRSGLRRSSSAEPGMPSRCPGLTWRLSPHQALVPAALAKA
eukprot:3398656-Rhodomonas_salina.1